MAAEHVTPRPAGWAWRFLACVAVVLAGCTGPGEGDPAAPSAGAASTSSPSPPHTAPSPAGPEATADHGETSGTSSHADTLEQFAAMAGIDDPPEVQPVRVITSAEWPEVTSECLTGAGFPVTVGDHGDVGIELVSPDQSSAYDRAMYVCMAQHPVDSQNTEALTDEQLGRYYDWALASPLACMRERGHPVAEPPTLPTFIANYRATGELSFFADGLPPGQEAQIMSDVLEHCETEPPVEVLGTG